jgi:hypothetical protein
LRARPPKHHYYGAIKIIIGIMVVEKNSDDSHLRARRESMRSLMSLLKKMVST